MSLRSASQKTQQEEVGDKSPTNDTSNDKSKECKCKKQKETEALCYFYTAEPKEHVQRHG